jgi:hypothetical protein
MDNYLYFILVFICLLYLTSIFQFVLYIIYRNNSKTIYKYRMVETYDDSDDSDIELG